MLTTSSCRIFLAATMCERMGGAAPVPPLREIPMKPGAANCRCYPANPECPSEVTCGDESRVPRNGHPGYMALLEELRALHKTKSGGYGTSTDPFANFSQVAVASGQPRYLYPVLRSIEKLTRVLSLHEQGRTGELEEELLDVASLNLCAAAMLREDS